VGILSKNPSNVVRVELQHFTNIIKTKKPVIILAKDPLGRFRENPFAASSFSRVILEITVDGVFQHGRD
jgi:hypothetical protein